MENKLEQLLNSLIEKGWKPFGEGIHRSNYKSVRIHKNYKSKKPYAIFYTDNHSHWKVLRQVTSKESGLWQFVCDREHRFIDKKNYEGVRLDKRLKNPYADYDDVNTEYEWITSLNYKYWIIESSLKDESELEDFLLSNIVIKDE